MPSKPIVMTFMQEMGFTLLQTDAYEIKFTPHWRWVQAACWKFLRWSGCIHAHFDRKAQLKQVVIDPEKIVSEIVRQGYLELQRGGVKPTKVFIGGAQFQKLCGEDVFMRQSFAFDVQLQWNEAKPNPDNPYAINRTIFSLPIHVIPWMDGVLVL